MFSSQMDTGRKGTLELESRLAKETFFRARFEAKQKPISRPCPSLACLLSSSLFSYGGGGALRCTAAATSRQFSSKKSSLSIYFIDNISIRQAVGIEGGAGGAFEPHLILAAVQVKPSPSKDMVYYFPLQILSPPDGPSMLLVAASQIMGWGKNVTNAIRGELNVTYMLQCKQWLC